MNIVDILKLVDKSESVGDVGVSLKLYRKCSGRKARIVPGLFADVLRWGDKHCPSLVNLNNKVARQWAARSKHAVFRTWAAAIDSASREQALILVNNTFGIVEPEQPKPHNRFIDGTGGPYDGVDLTHL